MTQPTYEQLLDENRQLRAENAQLKPRVAQLEDHVARLEAQVQRLTAQLQEALRAAKRQAAPFSKGGPKPNPKPPGRQAGEHYGPKAHRAIPQGPPDEILDAPLPESCPHCGGTLVEDGQSTQYQMEIPRRPIVRRIEIHRGRCRKCGRRVHGRHPLQTSDALGAAGSQLGPEAQAALVHLNKDAGLSHGKIADLFATMFGLSITPGGVCQAMLRAGRRGEPIYHDLRASVSKARWVVPDETGWRIGGELAWLHAFVTELATVYDAAMGRGYEVAEAILGERYAGTMIHDGWSPYDRFLWADHQQCLAHLLRRCKNLLETATGGAVIFPRQVHDLLLDALNLRDRRDAAGVSPHGLAVAIGRLNARLDRMLRWIRTHPDNERFAKHLARHRRHLFTFLRQTGIDATNYRVEQALRPAAVNRKVWGGNRTLAGAHAQSVLLTVLRTCRQQGRDRFTFLVDLLCGRPVHLALLPAGP